MNHNLIIESDPLFHPSWIKFNEDMWEVVGKLIELKPSKGNSWILYIVVYFDCYGKIVQPPRNPYLPVYFYTSSSKLSEVLQRKREALEKLSELFQKYGLNGNVKLSPEIEDMRFFYWKKFFVKLNYTYKIDLSKFRSNYASSLKTKINKARKLGYTCEITTDFDSVCECLAAPEKRKNFSHRFSVNDMYRLYDLLGSDNLLATIVKDANQNIMGAWVQLYSSNGLALGWSAGIKTEGLKDGVNFLLGDFTLDYLCQKGCKSFDLVGANIPSIAKMKEAWGGDLIVYYTIWEPKMKNIFKEIYKWYCFK